MPAASARQGQARRRRQRQAQRLVQHRVEQGAQRLALRLPCVHAGAVLRMRGQEGLDLRSARSRELAVGVGVQVGLGDGAAHGR